MTEDVTERPSTACLTCHTPQPGQEWRRADDRYRTCSACLDRMRATLRDVIARYHRLNPDRAQDMDQQGRGSPGFGSRSPASEHVIAMRDWRSKSCETARDATTYVWDPQADRSPPLPPGVHGPVEPPGAYVEKREVWYGRDGRAHTEDARPPRSVPLSLASLATMVAEDRGMTPPTTRDVTELGRWLDVQLDYVTRQEWVTAVDEDLRGLAAQLRPVTGDGRRKIGNCPNTVEVGDRTRTCGATLYAPTNGSDTIGCRACGRVWLRREWLWLGDLLNAS